MKERKCEDAGRALPSAKHEIIKTITIQAFFPLFSTCGSTIRPGSSPGSGCRYPGSGVQEHVVSVQVLENGEKCQCTVDLLERNSKWWGLLCLGPQHLYYRHKLAVVVAPRFVVF